MMKYNKQVWGSEISNSIIIIFLVLIMIPITSSPGQNNNFHSKDHLFKRAKKLNVPPLSTVDINSARGAAQMIRRGYFGAMIGQGAGESMTPLYGDNSFFVLRAVDFDSLERGTIIAYRNQHGQIIIHQLIRKRGQKWMAQGLNNNFMDNEWVTDDKFIGVVYAVFHTNTLPNFP